MYGGRTGQVSDKVTELGNRVMNKYDFSFPDENGVWSEEEYYRVQSTIMHAIVREINHEKLTS